MTRTDGWVTKPLWRDDSTSLGVIPVELSLATCPHCGMRWDVRNLLPPDEDAGRVIIRCEVAPGGCGKPFHMEDYEHTLRRN